MAFELVGPNICLLFHSYSKILQNMAKETSLIKSAEQSHKSSLKIRSQRSAASNNGEQRETRTLRAINEPKYQCPYCPKIFTMQSQLIRHEYLHSVYTGRKGADKKSKTQKKKQTNEQFICKVCNKTFRQKTNLMSHSKTHHLKMWKCNKCSVELIHRADIEYHKRVHQYLDSMGMLFSIGNGKFIFQSIENELDATKSRRGNERVQMNGDVAVNERHKVKNNGLSEMGIDDFKKMKIDGLEEMKNFAINKEKSDEDDYKIVHTIDDSDIDDCVILEGNSSGYASRVKSRATSNATSNDDVEQRDVPNDGNVLICVTASPNTSGKLVPTQRQHHTLDMVLIDSGSEDLEQAPSKLKDQNPNGQSQKSVSQTDKGMSDGKSDSPFSTECVDVPLIAMTFTDFKVMDENNTPSKERQNINVPSEERQNINVLSEERQIEQNNRFETFILPNRVAIVAMKTTEPMNYGVKKRSHSKRHQVKRTKSVKSVGPANAIAWTNAFGQIEGKIFGNQQSAHRLQSTLINNNSYNFDAEADTSCILGAPFAQSRAILHGAIVKSRSHNENAPLEISNIDIDASMKYGQVIETNDVVCDTIKTMKKSLKEPSMKIRTEKVKSKGCSRQVPSIRCANNSSNTSDAIPKIKLIKLANKWHIK